MRYLRALLGIIVGYLIVTLGLSLIVTAWWVNEWLPFGAPAVIAIVLALPGIGWLSGLAAAKLGGPLPRLTIFGVGGAVLIVLIVNIILGIAAEPVWFTALSIALVIPAVLISGSRATIAATRRAERAPAEPG